MQFEHEVDCFDAVSVVFPSRLLTHLLMPLQVAEQVQHVALAVKQGSEVSDLRHHSFLAPAIKVGRTPQPHPISAQLCTEIATSSIVSCLTACYMVAGSLLDD